ncbi:hybrid sensor histidine kinase/response regulator transcription factor [Mucilaginibacter paludis]|uniref:histidine kinase n=1 Tax=Mucilaginibacter paludis DSM 18603 TaxID=714943 RepID=H1YBD6_9SPHI|nr:two-component regulator propeller domain-containing protein [Mucilaginibacter paludis]EHQ31190.1 histidine kinase [Mucilaginibacter paludis DSM 18603]
MLALCIAFKSSAQARKLKFKHISIEQGLSNSTIEVIFQDSRGFMWFGTRDGLNRYDGNSITVYRNNLKDTTSISDNYISCIYEDRYHNLWIGTINGLNSYNSDRNNFIRYKHSGSNVNSISSNNITGISRDNHDGLWISTNGGGLNHFNLNTRTFNRPYINRQAADIHYLYADKNQNLWLGTATGLVFFDVKTKRFSSYPNRVDIPKDSKTNVINFIQQDASGALWLGTEDNGLILFDPAKNVFTPIRHSDQDDGSLSGNMIKSLLVDHSGQLWAGTINGGLNQYDAKNHVFNHYQNQPQNSSSLSQRTISALFEDRQGNLWVGTHRGGINLYTPGADKFKLFQQEASGKGLSYNDVKTFCQDRDGDIWIGTDGGGLNLFDKEINIVRHYRYNPKQKNTLGADAVLDITQDSRNNIWVSTWGGGLNLLDKQTGNFTRFLNNPADSKSISSNKVQKVFEDSRKNLWVATYYGGLNLYNRKTHTFTRVNYDAAHKTSLKGNNVISVNEDKAGNIWIGTDDGGLNCYDPVYKTFTHYFDDGERMPDLRVIFVDSKGRVWIGQAGLYLFDAVHKKFALYTGKGGLSTEFIKGIAEDEKGNFWISTSNGLTQFNPDNYYCKKYNTGDGLQGLEFEANAFLKTRDGQLLFGGVNGFNAFYPHSISVNQFIPPVYITNFQIFNKKVIAGEKDSPLQKDVSLTSQINLTYRQSDFSFNYASLNYTSSDNNQYAYKLEGLDKTWNYVGNQKKANYTNLSPGTYTFRVKASNNDGVWNEKGASLKIVIAPPFWKTWWFTLLIAGIVFMSTYYILRLKRNLELRKLEEQKREEIHQLQLQFFTNISHEFRTPLTLILGPLEILRKGESRIGFTHYYNTIHRNANRLMGLINELMDFRKVESGVLNLKVMPGNPNLFLSEIADEFYDLAQEKNITFKVNQSDRVSEAWFDRQIVEKIMLNLVNNAFKYTPNNGEIVLEVLSSLKDFKAAFQNELMIKNGYQSKNYIYFRVADSGIGISKESIQHLFERYYRITESHMGSGVGLAFVKSLTTLHKGEIYVYSQKGEGTEIIIALPCNAANYDKDERWLQNADAGIQLESIQYKGAQYLSTAEVAPRVAVVNPSLATGFKHVLIVDDNEELRAFLIDSLSPYFEVDGCADGYAALEKIKHHVPDLIISDVMMPGMDGNAFCKAVKQNEATSYIPFIMLTAKDALDSNIEGVESGADFYFAKPISIGLLLLTINNIFEQSQKLKKLYINKHYTEGREQVHAAKDKEFLDKLTGVIEAQLTNPDLDVDYLCSELNMGRTKLYEKLKSTAGQSIIEFVRTIKLRNAARIMTHEDVSITEVMYRVGIQTQSYFTKAFKKEFNKTPSQFLQDIDRKN